MMAHATFFRSALTRVGVLAVALAAMGLLGCSATRQAQATEPAESPATLDKAKFELDRRAILGMAGQFDVTFDFEETVAIRPGYELKEPYHSKASELVVVIKDTGEHISLQHLLVVEHNGKAHVVKHWRQDWRYEATAGYDFVGDNVWQPLAYNQSEVQGAWVQSVYQVDDSPRYWGLGRWVHRDGVSTWSAQTNRTLPRRELSRRDDYQVLGAINTHVVTQAGWMHYQINHKIDKTNKKYPVLALESGVNTYAKTTDTDFSAAREYWTNTRAYWKEVRNAWAEVYAKRDTIKLANRWKGDKMYAHIFDLADEYWGQADASSAKAEVQKVIEAFLAENKAAQP